MNRRQFLGGMGGAGLAAAAGLVSVGGFGGRGFNLDHDDMVDTGPTVGLEQVVTGLGFPTAVGFLPETDGAYVLELPGAVRVVEDGELRSDPALDLSDRVVTGGERGMLGIALHPRFGSNRRVYLRYSAPPQAGTPEGDSHTFVVAEFRATPDRRRLRPETERTVLTIPQPHRFHNAGGIAFGPDGYLYVGVGDGGHDYDQGPNHAEDWYEWNRGGNGQDVTENLLGSVLRIDVDDRTGGGSYGIPDDNPLVGREGLPEHYAWGFRNPWKLSFDGEDLFVGDVGQGDYEEVDLVRAGGNYGWNVREGPMCLNARSNRYYPLFPLPWCPSETPEGRPLVDPILHYPHQVRTDDGVLTLGSAVVGGHVCRSDGVPALRNRYVFGDYLSPTYGSGRLFCADRDDGGDWSMSEVFLAGTETGRIDDIVLGFGRDPSGDVYVLHQGREGALSRFVASE